MVESFGLENNEWIGKTYEKREHWANAYLCDKFCAGVRTTSRYEGINSTLKKFIRSGNCLLELVENLDRVVKDYRNNEFMTDFKCLYSELVMTTELESIEKVVSKVYTREIFFEVKKQIESVAALIVLQSESYELEIEVLPTRLVLRRWCKDAKSLVSFGAVPVADPEKVFQIRYGSLWSALAKLTKETEATGSQGGRNRFGRACDVHVDILDPTIVKSKGAPMGSTNARMGRRCRRCHGLRHDRRNCNARNEGPEDEVGI
ncbi:hypothetical protein AHAS_Ahas10G0091500 [Arachis hypogaea]